MSTSRPGRIEIIPVEKVEVLNPRERNGRVFEEIVGHYCPVNS